MRILSVSIPASFWHRARKQILRQVKEGDIDLSKKKKRKEILVLAPLYTFGGISPLSWLLDRFISVRV
jgi:hypothetical protein